MKKLLFLTLWVISIQFVVADQARSMLTMGQLTKDPAIASKILLFCGIAIKQFGVNELSEAQVLERLSGRSKSTIEDVEFESFSAFRQWVKGQKKTLLFLYEPENIKSTVCELYLECLAALGSGIAVFKVQQDDFIRSVGDDQPIDEAVLYPLIAVPDIIFIINGTVWQLSAENVLDRLKAGIDHMVYGLDQ